MQTSCQRRGATHANHAAVFISSNGDNDGDGDGDYGDADRQPDDRRDSRRPVGAVVRLGSEPARHAVHPGAAQTQAQTQSQAQNANQQAVVGWLELSGPLREGPVPFSWVGEADAKPSLRNVVDQLEYVADNPQYRGVVIYLDRPELKLTEAAAIGDAIAKVCAKNKKVLTFAEEYDLLTYMLASSADQILLQHHGRVQMAGLSFEEMYLAGLLNKIGAKADLMQVGEFKGARDPLTRTEPSDGWNQNMDGLLDDLYDQILTRIADGRQMTRAQVEQMMTDSWTMTDADYLRRRVVDRLTDRDLVQTTEIVFGNNFSWDSTMGMASQQPQQVQSPFALFRMLFKEPQTGTSRDSIAVIHAYGPIASGDSKRGGGLFGKESIGSKTMIKMLGRVRDDPHIKGVVIRINSPGGSALASEVIWQAVRSVAEKKPVFVSVGRLAASGGYYIACAADEIYIAPQSIVGSIGVVGGKIVLGGLYKKLDIHVYRRTRGPMADMFNSVEPFTDKQRTAMQESLERVYHQFLDRVKIGRGNRVNNLDALAKGRIFSGRQAIKNGLADKIGSLDDAITALATRAGLKQGQYDVVNLPPPLSLGDFVNGLLGVHQPQLRAQGVWFELAREALGPRGWRESEGVLTGLMMLREEPALTLMPFAIVIR